MAESRWGRWLIADVEYISYIQLYTWMEVASISTFACRQIFGCLITRTIKNRLLLLSENRASETWPTAVRPRDGVESQKPIHHCPSYSGHQSIIAVNDFKAEAMIKFSDIPIFIHIFNMKVYWEKGQGCLHLKTVQCLQTSSRCLKSQMIFPVILWSKHTLV